MRDLVKCPWGWYRAQEFVHDSLNLPFPHLLFQSHIQAIIIKNLKYAYIYNNANPQGPQFTTGQKASKYAIIIKNTPLQGKYQVLRNLSGVNKQPSFRSQRKLPRKGIAETKTLRVSIVGQAKRWEGMSGKECHRLEEHVKGKEHTQKVPNGKRSGKRVAASQAVLLGLPLWPLPSFLGDTGRSEKRISLWMTKNSSLKAICHQCISWF